MERIILKTSTGGIVRRVLLQKQEPRPRFVIWADNCFEYADTDGQNVHSYKQTHNLEITVLDDPEFEIETD